MDIAEPLQKGERGNDNSWSPWLLH
jgi:hypothetical protein